MNLRPVCRLSWDFLKQNKLLLIFLAVIVLFQAVRFSFAPSSSNLPIRILALVFLISSFCFTFTSLLFTYQIGKPKTVLLVAFSIFPIFLLALYSLEDYSQSFSYRFVQISIFVSLFTALYLFLRKNILEVINENLLRFKWSELSKFYQPSTNQEIAHCELTTGSIFQPDKNQIITKNCLVDSGSAVFALLKQPFRWSKSYVTTGDSVPAGSYLVAGKIELSVEDLKDQPYLSFLKEYFFSGGNDLQSKYYYLFGGFYFLVCYLYLSVEGFSLVNIIVSTTVIFSLSYFLDLAYLVNCAYPALKERLASRAIFCNDFFVLRKKEVSWGNIDPSLPIKKVGKLMVLSDLISEGRVALLAFYLTSYSDNLDFQAIHEEMQSNYFQKYLNNPLEDVRVYDHGFLATLEGVSLCFGSEQFLLENGIVLNTNEVMGRTKNKHAYYLSLNREVYAGIEVSDRLFQDCSESLGSINLGIPTSQKSSLDLPIVDTTQLGKNLQIVSGNLSYESAIKPTPDEKINIFFGQTFSQMIAEQRKYLLVFNLVSLNLIDLPFRKIKEYLSLQKYLFLTSLVSLLIIFFGAMYQFIALQMIALLTFGFILLFRKKLVDLLDF